MDETYGGDDLEDILEQARALSSQNEPEESLIAMDNSTNQTTSLASGSALAPASVKRQKGDGNDGHTTTGNSAPATASEKDFRDDDDLIAKVVDSLCDKSEDELQSIAKKLEVEEPTSGSGTGRKAKKPAHCKEKIQLRIGMCSTSTKFKELLILLNLLPTAPIVPLPLPRFASPTARATPHPNWSAHYHQFPSGPRKVYTNQHGKTVQSAPATYRFESKASLVGGASTSDAPTSPERQAKQHSELPPFSPTFLRLANNLHLDLPADSSIRSRGDAIFMHDDAFGASTAILRDASLCSLQASSSSMPVAPCPAPLEFTTPLDDADARNKEWDKLRGKLPIECYVNMCGGQRMYDATPSSEAEIAINRKALLAAGREGASLARDRLCLDKYHEYRRIKGIALAPYPIPPAIASNCAQFYMESSPLYSEGGARTIGPGIMAAFAHLQKHFGLPVCLDAPAAESIGRHAPSGRNKAEPVPIWLWKYIETRTNSPLASPIRFYYRNLWLCIAISARAQDFHRANKYHGYDIPHAEAVLEIAVTKAGEEHIVVGLSTAGLNGEITWIQEHMDEIKKLGFATPNFVGDIRTASKFTKSRMSSKKWQTLILQLFEIAGNLTPQKRRRMRITAHSPHSTSSSISAVLQWHETARADLGRWAHKGGQGHMPHRYSTRASAINQMYLRATLINAVRDICPRDADETYDIEQLRDSPFYHASLYVGPFVTYHVHRRGGGIQYDAVSV